MQNKQRTFFYGSLVYPILRVSLMLLLM